MRKQKNFYQKIKYSLLGMKKEDQRLIKSGRYKEAKTTIQKHTKELKKIIKQIDWPNVSKVGRKASRAAWLFAQHSVHDPKFQKRCLTLMKKEKTDEVEIKDVAYLDDRVRVQDGRRQVYGTQFYTSRDKKIKPRPIFKIKELDIRRQAVNLPPFEDYRKQMEKLYNQ